MSQDITLKGAAEMVSRPLHEPLHQAPAGSLRPSVIRNVRLATPGNPIQFFLMADQAAHLQATEAPGISNLCAGRLFPATPRVFGHSSRTCVEHGSSRMM